jgi:hypothetical protein
VVEEQPSYTFEVAGGKLEAKLIVTHGAGGRFGGVTKGGALYGVHVQRRISSDGSKQ